MRHRHEQRKGRSMHNHDEQSPRMEHGKEHVKKEKVSKVTICHYDEETDTYKSITIGARGAQRHMDRHEEDYEGECAAEPIPVLSPSDG